MISTSEYFRQTSQARYDLFIEHLHKGEPCFTLADAEGCLILTVANEKVLPLWPTSDMATDWAAKEHSGFSAFEIGQQDLVEKWLPGMSNDGFSVGVAPNMSGEGIVVQAGEFLQDIQG